MTLNKLDNLRADLRSWGWMRSLFIRVMSVLHRLTGLHLYRINVRPLIRRGGEPHVASGLSLRVVQPEELLNAAGDPDLDMPAAFVRSALARGDMAFGAFEGERLVGYTWRTFSAAPYSDGLWARVRRPYQYTYKSFTRPAYRGRHIHADITLCADMYLLKRGYTAEVGFIDLTNFTSIGVAKYLGRRRIAYAGYMKWFGRRILFRTPAARKVGAELFELRDNLGEDGVG